MKAPLKILIIEDEIPAAKRLISLIHEIDSDAIIMDTIDEIDTAVKWLSSNPKPDLIFMDIQLADGFSFEIFDRVKIETPVIFATAFDQYAINAFRVNGLDYLLKPIQREELHQSMERFREKIANKNNGQLDVSLLTDLLRQKDKRFKERFLVKTGEQLNFVRTSEIAYFLSESGYSFVVTRSGNRYILDETMDQIEDMIDPDEFFRINRKQLISLNCIEKISPYFNNRLKLDIIPEEKEESIVSRGRVKTFKAWLNK